MSASLATALARIAARTRLFAAGDPAVAEAARQGLLRLRNKSLPPWLLYDEEGSALFERITRLPEYYLSRTERAILTRDAGAIIGAAGGGDAGGPLGIVELGAGSAAKTRLLLEAALERQPRLRYVPVDVSRTALDVARAGLRGLSGLEVAPAVARYPEELGFLQVPARGARRAAERRLVIFLGSNIGNYDGNEGVRLLGAVRRRLAPGDALLVGADRRKSPTILLPAYDDAAGVTAAFNKNVLVRLDQELGAAFDPELFDHIARWNDRASRVELYLQSKVRQRVEIAALGAHVELAARERIHTESSYKLTPARLQALLARAGFAPEAEWHDARRWFGLTLARVPARRR